MTKKPLINHKFDQIDDAQRPRHVAPGGPSGCWERPQVVAVGRRSRLVRRSQIDTIRATSGFRCGEVALERKWRATSCCRSGKVALRGRAERVYGVAPVGSLPCTARPMITLITSFELHTHPNVPKNSMWYSNT
ncbi:hypothetical protein F2Q70_00042602 [Brassica cretica]|uniref:Uncharacterized protein n=1 Tax=Brassica cretica TaxID=69181 RepID=A0A8S9KIE2_BRACR|nr:hypothetical protein F2Q70_00042602 [Brassica cretica]